MKMISQKLETLISENREVFFEELKSVIKPTFTGLENPSKYKSILKNTLDQSKRTSLLRQSRLVAAATEHLEMKKNRSLLISAEMGSGKTDVAIKISMSNKLIPVYMIVCPPHLIQTWIEELAENYRDPNAYKVIRVKRYEDIAPYAKRNLWNDGIKYYFLIARENLKLSYPKDIAVKIQHRQIETEQEFEGQKVLTNSIIQVATCPCCGETIIEGDENDIDLEKVPMKCKGLIRTYHKDEEGEEIYRECGTILRQPSRSCSRKLGTRESVADFIFKNFTKGSYNVILDEVHEYKGSNTGQGNAMGRLVAHSRKAIGLTGTLMNGYSSSLFFLLYRLNPSLMMKDLGYNYSEVKAFIKDYGAMEETFAAKDVDIEGKVTRMGRKISTKEKARINPKLLSVLLKTVIFLKLEEIKMPNNLQLPPYEEIVDLVEMEQELYNPYMDYIEDITKRIRTDKRLLGNLATDAIAIPDMPFIPRDAQGVCFYKPKVTREEFGLTNKEKRLIENVRVELEQGRDCLVYITFSNQQVATDLEEILKKAFPTKTIKFLPSTVPPAKRKEWIKKNPSDVLICNPELVKTGLTLLDFVTIIFYETTYNVFTLKQASRRSWRIGQQENVKVIFMAYKDTPQHKALEMIGRKINAANSLEGRLSGEDDLSNINDDDEDNIQLALAKSILNSESSSSDIKMTSIKNFGADRDYDNFELYYQSLIDEDQKIRQTVTEIDKPKVNTILQSIPSKITFENMIKTFATKLLDHHNSGDLYGGIKSTHIGYRGKEEITTSCKCSYPLFEIDDEYRDGKVEGLAVTYNRDEENIVMGIEIRSVYFNTKNNIPFETKKEITTLSKTVLNFILEECKSDIEKLSQMLITHLRTKNEPKSNKTGIDALKKESRNQEIGFIGIIGKGKKAKRVKATSANSLFDAIPETTGNSCIQMAFDF